MPAHNAKHWEISPPIIWRSSHFRDGGTVRPGVQPWRDPAGARLAGLRSAAGALAGRHSASNVGKSKSLLAASAGAVAAAQASRLSYRVGIVATGVQAAEPSAQPKMAMTKKPGPIFNLRKDLTA